MLTVQRSSGKVLGPVRGVGVRVSGEEVAWDEAGYSAKVG
jgi:hypothetical protein